MKLRSILARGLLCPLFAVAVFAAKADGLLELNIRPNNVNWGYLSPNPVSLAKVDDSVRVEAIAKPGYCFDAWDLSQYIQNPSSFAVTLSTNQNVLTITRTKPSINSPSVFAMFKLGSYTVDFDPNGGVLQGDSPITVTNRQEGGYQAIPTAAKNGYLFKGWVTNGVDWAVKQGDSVWLTENVRAVAKWEKIPEVTFNFQGGAGGTEKVQPTSGLPMPAITIPTREGYAFGGYYTSENGSGTQYYAEGGTSKRNWDKTEDLVLYAKWTAKSYSVSASTSVGKLYVNSSGRFKEPLSISFTASTEEGYNFVYSLISIYADGSTGGSPIYEIYNATQGTFTMGDNTDGRYYDAIAITATCQRVAKTITVSFDGNGGALPSDESKKIVTYDSPYGDLPQATRMGYDFQGWFTYSSGGVQITNETKVTAVNDQTLYAHWQAKTYMVVPKVTDGCTLTVAETGTFNDYLQLQWTEGVKTGYAPTNTTVELSTVVDESPVILATYESGTSASYRMTEVYYPSITISVSSLFKPNVYRVSFDSLGGSSANSKDVTYDSTYGELPPSTLEGYDLVGWFTQADGGEEVTSKTVVAITAPQTLYARWKAKEYTVTTEATGGEIEVDSVGIFNRPLKLSWTPAAETGYTYSFASAKVEGVKGGRSVLTNYTNAASAAFTMTKMYYTNIVVSAIYTKTANKYTVNFDLSGVSGSIAPLSCTYDQGTFLPTDNTSDALKKGDQLKFQGWSRTQGATEPDPDLNGLNDVGKGIPAKNLAPEGSITLYAVWQDTRGELTKAAHAEGVELTNIDGSPFEASSDQYGTFIRSKEYGQMSAGTVNGPGQLEFLWKGTGSEDNYLANFEFQLDGQYTSFAEIGGTLKPKGWRLVQIQVPGGNHSLYFNSFSDTDADGRLYLDKIIWTTVIEPTEADRRDISAVTMENGELAISFENADSRFAYSLHGTNDLTAARALWPVLFTTNDTGTITIRPEVKPDEKQFFYYLEVHSK